MYFPLISVLLMTSFLSCKQNKQAQKTAQTNADTIITKLNENKAATSDESLLHQYEQYLNSLDTKQMTNVKEAMRQYQWMFSARDSGVCDSAYTLFHQFYEQVYSQVQEQRPEKMNNSARKHYLGKIKPLGFTLAQYEGEDYHTQDRDSINPFFYPYVSAVMKEFMQQQHTETNQKSFAYEGGISISAEELANRYAFWQGFGFAHPDFMMKTRVLLYANQYERYFLSGAENTPLRIDGKLNELYRAAFEYLLARYGDHPWATVFKPYYEALLKGDEDAIDRFKEWFDTADNKSVLNYD